MLGDAISSFNPIYGQGMSSAALQIEALQNLLNERAQGTARLDGLAPIFFGRAAQIVTAPWTLAANADFAYPRTIGERPPDLEQRAQYFTALETLCAEDVQVHILVAKVINLVTLPSALNEEPLRSRVLAKMPKQVADN